MKKIIPFLFMAVFSQAASTSWQGNEHGRVRLIAAQNQAVKGETVMLGLHFQPQQGWYLYWKDPGEAGIPPAVSWSGTQGLTAPEILWPMPKKIVLPGDIIEYGYQGEMVYPVRARVNRGKVEVRAKVSYLTCYTSCIPYTYTFTLDIPLGDKAIIDDEAHGLIEEFAAKVPSGLSDAQIREKAETVHINPIDVPSSTASGVPISGPVASVSLWAMLLFAFIGGIILNIMPCVLPVLSIKLAGLLQHAGQDKSVVVRSALASAAGILASFWALALAVIAARSAGHAVGWGIQFQNPWFVGFLLVVILVFAINLWGLFEIQMPRFMGRLAAPPGDSQESLASHFVSGLFATLLATPCSAPFLGTAMGFALAQSAGTILLMFTAVGAGLALPYFVLAAFPRSVRWLPKPGVWMLTLKKFLSVLLFMTALWLGWVLYQQIRAVGPAMTSEAGLNWIPFDEAAIPGYLKDGKSVFVDVTADWCVTCKYNERFVLSAPAVAGEFQRRGTVMMRADWTNRNDVIAAYLKKYGRAGIPFYAFYAPGKEPIVFSEFLTEAKVLKEIRRIEM